MLPPYIPQHGFCRLLGRYGSSLIAIVLGDIKPFNLTFATMQSIMWFLYNIFRF